MKGRESKALLSDNTLEAIKRHSKPIEATIGELLNAAATNEKKYDINKSLPWLLLIPSSGQESTNNSYSDHDSIAEKQAERLKKSEVLLVDNPIEDFIKVYRGLYPFLIASRYTANELVSLVIGLLKHKNLDESLVFDGISFNEMVRWIVLILAMEFGYSKDFSTLKPYQSVFGMTKLHREYWLYDLTQTLYPLVKDQIKLTPNLRHVFKYDRYAANVKELYAVWDDIPFDKRDDEFTLPSGAIIRPSEYMLNKTRKIADADFFLREIMDRFAYINHLAYEKWDYYLLAPPLVELLKYERTSSRWHGAHSHIFYDPNDEAIRHKIMHIGENYYAQRLIGTPLCDHCSRIYALSPKHLMHIKDLHYPTTKELKTLHQNNLAIDMYGGL